MTRILVLIFCFLNLPLPLAFALSPGSISEKNVFQTMSSYANDFKKYVDKDPEDEMQFVGHRGGSFKEYANNVNDVFYGKKYLPINHLMDKAFSEKNLNAIEIDVQAWVKKESQNTLSTHIIILHDPIRTTFISKKVQQYFQDNSFEKVLTHFINQKYYKLGKKLHIEIKVKGIYNRLHPALTFEDKHLIKELFSTLLKVLKEKAVDENDQREILNALSFVSFNYYALDMIVLLGKDLGLDLTSYLILTTNFSFYSRFSRLIQLPFLNSYLINKVTYTKTLKGLWFDPHWIGQFTKLLNGLNSKRETPLKLFISTYGTSKERLLKLMELNSKESKLGHVEGLIFEIDRDLKQKFREKNGP